MTATRLALLIAALYVVTMAVVLLFAGCVNPLARAPVTPQYQRLYSEVIECSGIPARPLPAFYVLPPEQIPCCDGYWTPGGIYLADSPQGRADFTIQHELLHHLLRGDELHTSPAWEACDLEPGDQPIILTLH